MASAALVSKRHRPPWPVQMRYDWLWLYAAVEPATGHCVCLYLPALNHESNALLIIFKVCIPKIW